MGKQCICRRKACILAVFCFRKFRRFKGTVECRGPPLCCPLSAGKTVQDSLTEESRKNRSVSRLTCWVLVKYCKTSFLFLTLASRAQEVCGSVKPLQKTGWKASKVYSVRMSPMRLRRPRLQCQSGHRFEAYLENASVEEPDRYKDRFTAVLRTMWPRTFQPRAIGIRTMLLSNFADRFLRST